MMKTIKLLTFVICLLIFLAGCRSTKAPKISNNSHRPTVTGDLLTLNDGLTGSTSETAPAIWNAIESADTYEVAVGSTPGGHDIKDWLNIGDTQSATLSIVSTLVNGQKYYTSIRSVDTHGTFGPVVKGDGWIAVEKWHKSSTSLSFNGSVNVIEFDKNKNQYIAGDFSGYNPDPINNMVIINADGSINNSLSIGTGFNKSSFTTRTLNSGKIMVYGELTTFNEASVKKIIRLNANGSLDTAFNLDTSFNNLSSLSINYMQIDTSDNVYISFSSSGSYRGVLKLNSDGSVNNTFNTNFSAAGFTGFIETFTIDSIGKITSTSNPPFVRINSNGTLDLTLTTFVGAGGGDHIILSSGKILLKNYSGGLHLLDSQGALDTSFETNMGTEPCDNYSALREASDGKIYVVGPACDTFKGIRKFNADGTINTAFATNIGAGIAVDSVVYTVDVQADGKILITGDFKVFNNEVVSRGIMRLNSDGTKDTTFLNDSPGTQLYIYDVNKLPGGKFLLSGDEMKSYGGTKAPFIVKVNADNVVDSAFSNLAKINEKISDIKVVSDGMYIVGDFTKVNGMTRNKIAKITMDGVLDNTFRPSTGFDRSSHPKKIKIQKDGKILVLGDIFNYNGISARTLIRILKDGSRDNTFTLNSINGPIYNFDIQNDGKIILVGDFTTYDGKSANRIVRLLSNGRFDSTFNIGTGFNNSVTDVKILKSGKIQVIGSYSFFNGEASIRLTRINADGSIDNDFNSGASFSSATSNMLVTDDENIIISAPVTYYNDSPVQNIFRLNRDGALDTSFVLKNNSYFDTNLNVSINVMKQGPFGMLYIGGTYSSFDGLQNNFVELGW